MWLLWKEQNSWIFEDSERSRSQLELFFIRTLFDLSCAYKLLLFFRIHLNFVHNSFRLQYAHYCEHEVIILLI